MANIWHDSTTTIPKSDPQIVVVDMEQQDIGGRKSNMPKVGGSDRMSVTHVPNAGSKS